MDFSNESIVTKSVPLGEGTVKGIVAGGLRNNPLFSFF